MSEKPEIDFPGGEEPTELVITARAGTSLAAIESAMRARGQMLAFEPPRYGQGGTLGGAVASGLSGPRRPYAGAVRDLVLGVKVIDERTGSPIGFSESSRLPPQPASLIGAQTADVLADVLGIDATHTARLQANQVVGGPPSRS